MIFQFVLTLSSTTVLAWGPISHAYFNCLADGQNAKDCLEGSTNSMQTLVVGSDIPDALAFGRFNLSAEDDPNWLCSHLSYVHDAKFGQFMVENTNSSMSGFDELAFAKGFLGHVLGDLIGFYRDSSHSGILCTDITGGCTPTGVLYVPLWDLMSALDAFYLLQANANFTKLPLPDNTNFGAAAYTYLARMSTLYNQVDPTFKPVTASAVQQCVDFWRLNVNWVYQKSGLYSTASHGKLLLQDVLKFYVGPYSKNIESFAKKQAYCATTVIKAGWQGTPVSQLFGLAQHLYAFNDCNA